MVSAPWTLIAPLTVPGEDEGVYLWYGRSGSVLMHSAVLGRLGKALGERAVTEELDSLGLITPCADRSLAFFPLTVNALTR